MQAIQTSEKLAIIFFEMLATIFFEMLAIITFEMLAIIIAAADHYNYNYNCCRRRSPITIIPIIIAVAVKKDEV